MPFLNEKLGKDAIEDVTTTRLSKLIRVHHNYMPYLNMEKGSIKPNWPDELIFVDQADGTYSEDSKSLETFL